MFDERVILKAFNDLGVRAVVGPPRMNPRRRLPLPFEIDIRTDKCGEYYSLRADPVWDSELAVLDIRPSRRHLVLMLTGRGDPGLNPAQARFLCGHDERHWFVASLPDEARVTTVTQAMEALKPEIVHEAELRHGVRSQDRNRRRNSGFVRQGEWFFVPAREFDASGLLVHRHEPLRRGRGKPHFAEELVRTSGELVRFNRRFAGGLNEEEFRALLDREPNAGRENWRMGTRKPIAHVRGDVRHPDHRTVHLPGWHRVAPNTEDKAKASAQFMAFID
jgi:hypothetical protein